MNESNPTSQLTRAYVIVAGLAVALFLWANIAWHPWSPVSSPPRAGAVPSAPLAQTQPSPPTSPAPAEWDE